MQSFLFTAYLYVHVLQTFDRHGERHDYGFARQNLPFYRGSLHVFAHTFILWSASV
ncbi:hypothetical protein D1Q00_gp156 [Trichoplusia ni granulovirus LBIV-12]|uniref:Uncharacterized protein n=2 Tax=Betabaculovirus TaxID=558017 RepID=A0A1D8QLH1_GVTN|nr:hypothetical protein PsunGV_gp168 [Pseudalatia unipuncta granulovirus]YP_009506226.1 hypothetical protein D1Q00_gp156 [Trichoplusia ni granulovirus LBIV-12]ACH69518.1 unknown [Pseudalatia unipuncta granulovirus]AOW41494.1 hypothetical protein [Trichoplusia ni granulovirus LBIV-12]